MGNMKRFFSIMKERSLTILAIIPILVITAIFQHHIIGGLTAGSNK